MSHAKDMLYMSIVHPALIKKIFTLKKEVSQMRDVIRENQWLLAGLAAVVLVGGYLLMRPTSDNNNEQDQKETQTAQTDEKANKFLEESGLNLPEGVERYNLSGEGENTGIVTRKKTQGDMTEITVLAGLKDLESGYYQVELLDNQDKVEVLGNLRQGKGGYVLETTKKIDTQKYNRIRVSQKVGADPGKVVLEGEFKQET